jgi:hypothetical protein
LRIWSCEIYELLTWDGSSIIRHNHRVVIAASRRMQAASENAGRRQQTDVVFRGASPMCHALLSLLNQANSCNIIQRQAAPDSFGVAICRSGHASPYSQLMARHTAYPVKQQNPAPWPMPMRRSMPHQNNVVSADIDVRPCFIDATWRIRPGMDISLAVRSRSVLAQADQPC